MLQEAQIGRNGQKPERCAISGRALDPEDVYMPLGDVIVGVKAMVWRQTKPEQRETLRGKWRAQFAQAPGDKSKKSRNEPPPDTLPPGSDLLKTEADEFMKGDR